MSRSLFALAVVLAGAACSGSDGMLAPNHGRVRFVLGGDGGSVAVSGPAAVESWTDTEVASTGGNDALHDDGDHPEHPPIKSAKVTFSSILARNVDGVFVDVEMDLPVTVDVVTLEGGRQIQLPDGELPAATYDRLLVNMTQVQVVLWDDTEITVNPPGGGWAAMVPLCPPLEVEGTGTSTVSLSLEVRRSFFWMGDRFHFAPRFRPPASCGELPPPPPPPVG